jgi:hypothetical protein
VFSHKGHEDHKEILGVLCDLCGPNFVPLVAKDLPGLALRLITAGDDIDARRHQLSRSQGVGVKSAPAQRPRRTAP